MARAYGILSKISAKDDAGMGGPKVGEGKGPSKDSGNPINLVYRRRGCPNLRWRAFGVDEKKSTSLRCQGWRGSRARKCQPRQFPLHHTPTSRANGCNSSSPSCG